MNKLKNFTINFSIRNVKIDDGSRTISGSLPNSSDCSPDSSNNLTFPIGNGGGYQAIPPQPILPSGQLGFPWVVNSTSPYPRDYILIYTDKGSFENFNLTISVEYSDTKEGGTLVITKEYCLSSMAHQNKILTFNKGEHFNNMHFLLLPSQQYLFTIQDADIIKSTLVGSDKLIETHEIIFKSILIDETARDFLKVTLNGVGK